MPKPNRINVRTFIFSAITLAILASLALAACSSPKPAEPEQGPKRYALAGRVVSVEKAKNQVVVDAGDIPGFMMAMTMGYDVKDPSVLNSLSPEDQIKADVVVNQNDVHLENIVVVKKAAPSANQPAPATPPGKQ